MFAARRKRSRRIDLPVGFFASRLGPALIALLTIVSLAMISAVWWYYTVQKREMEAATSRALFAVAHGKSDQIANWRSERVGDGRVAMSPPIVRIAKRVVGARTVDAADRADLLDYMSRLATQFQYSDLTLVDLTGEAILRLREKTTDRPQFGKESRAQFASQAIQANDAVLSDLSADTRSGLPMMSMTVPVSDAGALIFDVDPSRFLFPYVEAWPGDSRTAEALLVRLEGDEIVYLGKLRKAPGAALFSRRHLPVRLPSDAALEAGFTIQSVDYRGAPVLGAARHIRDSPWYLICKIDVAEVEAPLRRLGWEMALLIVLIGVANVAGVGLVWKGQQTNLHEEREAWYYAIANDTPAYLWMASGDGENSFINRPLGEFFGSSEHHIATLWSDYVHPEDAGRAHANFSECLKARRGYTDEFRIRRFDGEYRWVVSEAVPRFSPRGNFLGFAGSLLDQTDRRNAEVQLRSANSALASQLEEQIRKEREIEELGARLIGAQEEERKRLARELHDDLNQQIAALSIAMGNLKRQIPVEEADSRASSDRIHQRLVHLAESVRRMSHELHPAILRYSGLAPALQSYCKEFGVLTGVAVSVAIEGDFDGVPPDAALCLYRITQEALRNVAKHARVATAAVGIQRADGLLSLTISDNGVGMDPASAGGTAGLGLVSIRERARHAGGKAEITSRPNQGTTIAVRIPG